MVATLTLSVKAVPIGMIRISGVGEVDDVNLLITIILINEEVLWTHVPM